MDALLYTILEQKDLGWGLRVLTYLFSQKQKRKRKKLDSLISTKGNYKANNNN